MMVKKTVNIWVKIYKIEDILGEVSYESCMNWNAPRLSEEDLVSIKMQETLLRMCEPQEFLVGKGANNFFSTQKFLLGGMLNAKRSCKYFRK